MAGRSNSHKGTFLSQFLLLKVPLAFIPFSVWPRVKLEVAAFTTFAILIYILNVIQWVEPSPGWSSLTSTLSMVTGLLVSFRSNSSYDRWYEGRRTWASIQSTSRSFLRLLAFSLPSSLPGTKEDSISSEHVRSVGRLVVAFSYSTMYHLRDETGTSYPGLRQLLPPSLLQSYESTSTLTGKLAIRNLPIALIRAMQSELIAYHTVNSKIETTVLDNATYSSCLGCLEKFTSDFTSLERIRDTPIPLILSIHLQVLLFVYIASLPLQLVTTLGMWMIPVTSIAAFIFYGVDRAAEELSDPFGTEPNDLPIERYVSEINREYLEMIESRP